MIDYNWPHVVLSFTCWVATLRVRAAALEERNELAQNLDLVFSRSEPAVVLRAGKISQVTAKDLVPGDIIHVSKVQHFVSSSFDVRLIFVTGLEDACRCSCDQR